MNKKVYYLIGVIVIGLIVSFFYLKPSTESQLLSENERKYFRIVENDKGIGRKDRIEFTTTKNVFVLKWEIKGLKTYSISVKSESGTVVGGMSGRVPGMDNQIFESPPGKYFIDINTLEENEWEIVIFENK